MGYICQSTYVRFSLIRGVPDTDYVQLLDSHLACYFGLPAQIPFSEIQTPLPTVEPDTMEHPASFNLILSSLLEHGQLPSILDDVGYSCVAHALYR